MGRIFLDHPGGTTLYSCANCDTALTNRSELTSMVRMQNIINTKVKYFDYLGSVLITRRILLEKINADLLLGCLPSLCTREAMGKSETNKVHVSFSLHLLSRHCRWALHKFN